MAEKIVKDPQEWKEQLTPDQYEICIKHGTEPPFSGKYNDSKLEGSFKCVCCGEELFSYFFVLFCYVFNVHFISL